MKATQQRRYEGVIVAGFFMSAAALAITLNASLSQMGGQTDSSEVKSAAYPPAADAPAIPTSHPEAKEYIFQASESVKAGDYDHAIALLREASSKYPDDKNLHLTLEYYERQAQNSLQ